MVPYNNCGPVPGAKDSNSTTSNSTSSKPSTGNTTTSTLSAGETFFNNTVKPAFNAKCMSCHNEPRFGGNGPLTIYGYGPMKTMLSAGGTTSVNNNLINKVQNIITHTGGNFCLPSGIQISPCSEIVAWWQTEFKMGNAGFSGGIDSITATGDVTGSAIDAKNPTAQVSVFFYINGPVGTGTSLGSVLTSGTDHLFTFSVPTAFRDGKPHDLYAYGTAATTNNLLPGAPKTLVAYSQKAVGMTFYNASLLPQLQTKCKNCHQVSYSLHYFSLLKPTPFAGGTATNNELINKASGSVSHGGGNLCGTKNSSPCLEMQTWWAKEFGP